MEKKKTRYDTFTTKDGSISITAKVGNGHGVHANYFPVKYEEIIDLPDDIIFSGSKCIISSAYCELERNPSLLEEGTTINQVVDEIEEGILWKKRQVLYHTELITSKSVKTYLKYVKTGDIKGKLKIFNFDKVLEFERQKTESTITKNGELKLYREIVNLDEVEKGEELFRKIMALKYSNFKKTALLLLKCKVYDLEDKHYLNTKTHDKRENDYIKRYRKTLFPQI